VQHEYPIAKISTYAACNKAHSPYLAPCAKLVSPKMLRAQNYVVQVNFADISCTLTTKYSTKVSTSGSILLAVWQYLV